MHISSKKKNEKNIIYWNCRRGMVELDGILIKFFKENYNNLNFEIKQQFKKLLIQNDNNILMGLLETKIKEYPIEFKKILIIIKKGIK